MPEWARATVEIVTMGLTFVNFLILMIIWAQIEKKGGGTK